MVDLKNRKVFLRNNEGNIIGFETWWIIPTGYCHDLDKAIALVEEMGLPASILRPVTVAMCDNGLYEPMLSVV